MASVSLPEPPAPLRAIQSYMKVATDIERVDPVVSYWVRLYATEAGFKIDKDSPESKAFLVAIISWLESFKKSRIDNEAITNPTVGQAHYENFVLSLFNKADTLDREGTANKTTIRMFYMAALLFEAMAAFGPLTEDVSEKAKYAKFKAAYIQKCFKSGLTPKPGPLEGADLQDPTSEDPSNTNGSDETPKVSEVPNESDHNIKPEPFILTPNSTPGYPSSKHPTMPMPPTTSSSNEKSSGYTQPSTMPNNPTPSAANSSSATTTPTPKPPQPSQVTSTINATKFHATNGAPLNPEDLIASQKYCKFANSALQYDDIPTAVANLEKALKLLTTGQK